MMIFNVVVGPSSLGLIISTVYCMVLYNNKYETLYVALIIVFPVFYFCSLLINFIFYHAGILKHFITLNHFIGKGFYTLSELADKIAEVRRSPPVYQVINMNNKEDVQNLQYVTWEEYGEFVSIPTDKPVCVYFLTNIDLSEAMQNDYNNQAKDKKIQLEKYINVNTDLLIAGDNIPFVVKFMTKPFMKVIYYILEIFSYSYLLDMIFYSNCKVLVVNSSKRAEIEPMYRAKAGEMDLEAPTSIFKDEKAESP